VASAESDYCQSPYVSSGASSHDNVTGEGSVANEVVRALRERASDARELARTCGNDRVAENILSYAAELDREAERLEKQSPEEHRRPK
jgi:hypothetical protein